MSTHNQFLYFARIDAGSTPKIAIKIAEKPTNNKFKLPKNLRKAIKSLSIKRKLQSDQSAKMWK